MVADRGYVHRTSRRGWTCCPALGGSVHAEIGVTLG